MSISFVHNTGIQYYQVPDELIVDSNQSIVKPLRFCELNVGGKVYLDPAYYFPMHNQYLRRSDLIGGGYLDPQKNEIAEEQSISDVMNWLDSQSLLSINRLDVNVGARKQNALQLIENRWLPMPFYVQDVAGDTSTPTNWCRMKLVPVPEKSVSTRKVYRVVLAFDTAKQPGLKDEATEFQGEPYKIYSFCGISQAQLSQMPDRQQKKFQDIVIPLKAYDFCNIQRRPWLNRYLQDVLDSEDLNAFPDGQKMKYMVYYIYLITYLHRMGILPDVKLYNDEGVAPIATNLVLDVGNSRTFGLVAEDPIDPSFSKSSIIKIRDLETGELYDEPFDMRLCFKEETFGISAGEGMFRWPSVVRLGKEAVRNIYGGEQDLDVSSQFDTNYSSPKRFLWDKEPYSSQWKYVSEKHRYVEASTPIYFKGIMEQFYNDGRFAADPQLMGEKSSYSRSSLMTFCFMEILLQVRQQINSYEFRLNNGQEDRKRVVKRVILTCPTAMAKEEQITLRQAMEEASVVLNRYYENTYDVRYDPKADRSRIEVIPSVRDLSYSDMDLYLRRNWNYDEATCCQMVYLYGELRRYLGNAKELFDLYGRRRNEETIPSLTIGSLDIGAGTTDIMICNYAYSAQSITPTPLFWESFKIAGDDLVHRIIVDVLLDAPQPGDSECLGIIPARLLADGCTCVSEKMNHFFSDTHSMGNREKRMRKEFLVQVLLPIANFLLDKLQKEQEEKAYRFDDIFCGNVPSSTLMDFFEHQMGFRFEDLVIRYSPRVLNETIRKVFEKSMRKWTALFHKFNCDIVLICGRPCSIKQTRDMIRRLHPVAPNRLISMHNYRVGSWYPGSNDIGHFRDNKSMVAVGALIAHLAEEGRLEQFRLNAELLKTKILPTSDYIGVLNVQSGSLEHILTPESNHETKEFSSLPICIGTKQVDVNGYPANMLYMLRFNEKAIRKEAISALRRKMPIPSTIPDDAIEVEKIAAEMDTLKFMLRRRSPLKFELERDYSMDKEKVDIVSVEDSERNDLPVNYFELSLQTWSEDTTNWLDTGIFKLHISI